MLGTLSSKKVTKKLCVSAAQTAEHEGPGHLWLLVLGRPSK